MRLYLPVKDAEGKDTKAPIGGMRFIIDWKRMTFDPTTLKLNGPMRLIAIVDAKDVKICCAEAISKRPKQIKVAQLFAELLKELNFPVSRKEITPQLDLGKNQKHAITELSWTHRRINRLEVVIKAGVDYNLVDLDLDEWGAWAQQSFNTIKDFTEEKRDKILFIVTELLGLFGVAIIAEANKDVPDEDAK